jgi:hypothetical protein
VLRSSGGEFDADLAVRDRVACHGSHGQALSRLVFQNRYAAVGPSGIARRAYRLVRPAFRDAALLAREIIRVDGLDRVISA